MSQHRRYALGGLFVAAGALAAALLASVLGTVFFAVTVAYLLWPLRQEIVDRGQSRRVASAGTTAAAFLATLLLLAPLAVVAYLRFDSFVAVIGLLPAEIDISVLGFEYLLTLESLTDLAVVVVERAARRAATAAPVLLVKVTLFVFLVYSLLFYGEDAHRAALALVPPTYRDAARSLNRRARDTLFAIYVLQAVTALGTFVLAVPVFFALGYDAVVTLATIAAVLQFIPIVGPSVLLAGLAAYHVALGQPVQAALVFLVGGFVVAWLPDVLIRPRLARETARIPGSLYFVGFFGGALTLGALGVVAGPLAVALFVESASLLSAELNPAELSPAESADSESGPAGDEG
ncbi:AI-2E family transporter [Halobellus rubicundus]|uniref:AI-2E family transporter n=1 Tax=Halobellus rubicundus TaxID=2996466 RepID=A0ABD5M7B4_9EURY